MFADINDGVAIIINSETGIYYGMNGLGTSIFETLLNGASCEKILDELKAIPGIPNDIEARFNNFINALVEKNLIIPSEEISAIKVQINQEIALSDNFMLQVSEYNDAQELLLADPIHEVKEEIGWSPERDALNLDLEDVARRESKME